MSEAKRRAEVIAQVAKTLNCTTYKHDLTDPETVEQLEIAMPEVRLDQAATQPDMLILEDASTADLRAMAEGMRPGAVLVGLNWVAKPPDVHRAVAAAFHLMDIAVGPETVWFWRKAPA